MIKSDAYKFDHQVTKFEDSQYKDFHPTHSRLDMELCQRFFKAFSKSSGFNTKIFGIDILVDEQSGSHYIIDFNYFSGFKETPIE